MSPLTPAQLQSNILRYRELRGTYASSISRTIQQHKALISELKSTDHHNVELIELIRASIKSCQAEITNNKKEISRLDAEISALRRLSN